MMGKVRGEEEYYFSFKNYIIFVKIIYLSTVYVLDGGFSEEEVNEVSYFVGWYKIWLCKLKTGATCELHNM